MAGKGTGPEYLPSPLGRGWSRGPGEGAGARRRRVVHLLTLAAFAVVVTSPNTNWLRAAAGQTAQQPESTTQESEPNFTIRAERNLVLVRATVRDAKGQPVSSLRKEDFLLFDNGKPQVITHFSVEKAEARAAAPTQAAKPATPAEKVEAAEQPPAPAPTRFLAFFFDDFHLRFEDIKYVHDAAWQFLKSSLAAGDRVGIFTTSGSVAQDFTDSISKLEDALSRVRPRPQNLIKECPDLTPFHAYLIWELHEQTATDVATQMVIQCLCSGDASHCPSPADYANHAAQRVLEANEVESESAMTGLENLVRRMGSAPGQRTIAFVSDGFMDRSRLYRLDDVINRALRLDVTINTLDARGLYTILPLGDASERGPMLGGNTALIGSFASIRTAGDEANGEFLAGVAAATGGVYIHDTNDYNAGIRRVSTLPAVYYTLAFSPQNLKADGSFHKIQVKLAETGQPLTIEARKGYYAPRAHEKPEDRAGGEIEEAVFSNQSLSEIPLSVQTQFFKTDAMKARLTVLTHADLHYVKFTKREGRNVNDLTFITGLFDSNGNYVNGEQQVVKLRLLDANVEKIVDSGLTSRTNFDVAPGTYMVREVVRDSEGGQMSAQSTSLDVPY